MSNINAQTYQLKTLIKKTKNSGKDAWVAGKILNELFEKDFNKNSSKFDNYTKNEFKIAGVTAKKYINIFKTISLEKIPEDILITHLYILLDTQTDIRLNILKVMTEGVFGKNKIPMGVDLKGLINNLEAKNKSSEKDIKQELEKILSQNKKRRGHKNKRTTFDEYGMPIISNYFNEITRLFPNEPISEQGLVGLFCAMFFILKKLEFNHENKVINFESIVYIRTPYPDARIQAINRVNNNLITLDVEFELNSSNYIKHGHHKEKNKKCDLIICWDNNLDKSSSYNSIPNVLSLKNLFNEGNIRLYNPTLKIAR
ncbi:hypothetical protein [Candidatus Venteria ishoeyi]|uniref:Uncharacterized protein n=1 Tax=Candidatus Venteria ishoeyi TaxID=1899563 RepID=A0A1H6FE56_9GAMM|nr:hypothetical protein [Candidatus Venteria ishoeyi]SEH07619.1 Uncharacterised protein [Candidatus Venteria ishoeyi]